ncbi:MAG: hypothetical protein ACE5GO_06830 [Anaerolineales bacterium]
MLLSADIPALYAGFDAPIAALDCGKKCAPYNRGVPVCCDTLHAVPTAYKPEWDYLQANTGLWHLWQHDDPGEVTRLQAEAGLDLTLIECQGYERCQREFRSIVCRAFPFFPYLDSGERMLGLSYYWEYEDYCWAISNLQIVSAEFRAQFIETYKALFAHVPGERETFASHSAEMRQVFEKDRRAIPLLHCNGAAYEISPGDERMRRVRVDSFPRLGPYVRQLRNQRYLSLR